jgi:hypothetical protein
MVPNVEAETNQSYDSYDEEVLTQLAGERPNEDERSSIPN